MGVVARHACTTDGARPGPIELTPACILICAWSIVAGLQTRFLRGIRVVFRVDPNNIGTTCQCAAGLRVGSVARTNMRVFAGRPWQAGIRYSENQRKGLQRRHECGVALGAVF